MKKNTKIIVAVVVILMMVIGGCIYGFVLEKNKVGTPSQDNTQTEPVTPSKPEKPDDTQQETPAVQPENPNPTGGESAVIYVPDEKSESLTPVGTDVADDLTPFLPVEINITQAVFFIQTIINYIRIRRNQGDQQITYKGNSHA